MATYVLVAAENMESCDGCCFVKDDNRCAVVDADEFDCSSGGVYKEIDADVWSMSQQQDEAYAEATFEQLEPTGWWMCYLDGSNSGIGETQREAFNHAWGRKMGALKKQVTEQMENTGMDIEEVLKQRGKRYGEYSSVSETAQSLKYEFHGQGKWANMEPYMQESLDMICNKLSRIINGDPYYDDSWRDIAGYAQLVVNELEKTK